jgi:hypothetical protein
MRNYTVQRPPVENNNADSARLDKPETNILQIMNSTMKQFACTNQKQNPNSALGWRYPRKVIYVHRHRDLQDQCLYMWNHRENVPEPTTAQDLSFQLEDIYSEHRGEFNAAKLVMDCDLGVDGRIRLVCGLNTTYSTTLLASLCTLSSTLISGPLALRVRPGTSHGVVIPSLFVDDEWVDGRPMARNAKGVIRPSNDLLREVQSLLRDALSAEMLPHETRIARRNIA